jgi:hypothetical protein
MLRAVILAAFGFVVLPAFAEDEKPVEKKDVDKKDVDKKAPEEVSAGSITGKVVQVDETKKTLKISVPNKEINQNEANAIANDTLQIQQVAATERNPVNRANRIAQLQQSIAKHQANLYKITYKDMDFTVVEEVKVRMANPPPKFDEKGKPIKYTPEELKELKGTDTKAPGYKAEFSDLRQKQVVQLVLMRKKGTPMIKKPDPGKKDVDPASVTDVLAEFAPHATTIIILAEAPPQ